MITLMERRVLSGISMNSWERLHRRSSTASATIPARLSTSFLKLRAKDLETRDGGAVMMSDEGRKTWTEERLEGDDPYVAHDPEILGRELFADATASVHQLPGKDQALVAELIWSLLDESPREMP